MQELQIDAKTLAALIIIPMAFVGFIIFLVIGGVRYFRHKDKEKLVYQQIAKQLNWNFSEKGEGIESAKPYFEYINRQIFPDRIRLGTFPVNILWGVLGNDVFAVFDFTYNRSVHTKSTTPPQYEKGVLIVSNHLNLPAFKIEEKNFLHNAISYISGKKQQNNFQIETNNSLIIEHFSNPAIFSLFEQNRVIRGLGYEKMFCLFFHRNSSALPDLSHIRFQIKTLQQLTATIKF